MTANLTNGLNSFIHQFDFIEESLMDFLLETALRLGALTETRLFLLVEGKNGRQFCGHRDYVSAFKSGNLELDSSKDDEVELNTAPTRKSVRKRTNNGDEDDDDDDDGSKLERLKRKIVSNPDESCTEGEVGKKRRLTSDVGDDVSAVSDAISDVTATSAIADNSIVVKHEREDFFDFDSKQIVSKSSSNCVQSDGRPSQTNLETRVCLPRVKVVREIEDPASSGGNSRFSSGLTPEECIEPAVGGMTTAIHDGVPLKVYKHRCEICYQQSDCFIDGAIPKHTVKILLPWCNEVAVVRHRGEQCYPCPDCERAAVTSEGIIDRNEEIRINSWENISSRLHTRLRQHYARHHHCFLNQVYKTPEEVKEFYITARKIRCQMIHGPSPRTDPSL